MHYKTNFKRTKKLSCPYNVIVIFKEYLNKIVDIYYRLTSINNIYTLLKYNILIHYFFENYKFGTWDLLKQKRSYQISKIQKPNTI
jgi:hypothetical protein